MKRAITTLLLAALVAGAGPVFAQSALPAASASAYSSAALYNLGNAYARAGQSGLAVLSYERATLLAPADPDIRANLNQVRAAAGVAVTPQRPWVPLIEWVTPTEAAWLGVLGLALIGMGVMTLKGMPRSRWLSLGAIVLGVTQLSLTAASAYLTWPLLHAAVVLVDQTAARVSPVPMADAAFVLRQADSVRIMARYQDFLLIRTDRGQSGWVVRADVAAVVP